MRVCYNTKTVLKSLSSYFLIFTQPFKTIDHIDFRPLRKGELLADKTLLNPPPIPHANV